MDRYIDTRANERKRIAVERELEAFVRSKCGRSKRRRAAAVERGAVVRIRPVAEAILPNGGGE